MKAWHQFLLQDEIFSRQAALQQLEEAGIETYPFSCDARDEPGLVFFEQCDASLAQFLRDSSRDGVQRVLAVAVARELSAGDAAWALLEAGAGDVLGWEPDGRTARQAAERLRRWQEVDETLGSAMVQRNLVGQCPRWIAVLRQVVEVARFTNVFILLTGESGTGKELVARLIHALNLRAKKRELVLLDCTTIVPELSGSEFFGHERGAFTGAVTSRDGVFALADGSTLFLDEVGELPLPLQAELLRVVQEHTYKRVGSNTWQHTDFRLVCATNRDLLQEVANGHFRRDLYYRIAGWTCRLPPLRERSEDILPLVGHFLRELSSEGEPFELNESVQGFLLKREYPGNIRDLKQLVASIVCRHVGRGPITVGDIPEQERPRDGAMNVDWRDASFTEAVRRALARGVGMKQIGRAAENEAVRIALANADGSLPRAAKVLGVSDRALQMRRAAGRVIAMGDKRNLRRIAG